MLLACLASRAGDRFSQEVLYYKPWAATPLVTKGKVRRIHTVIIDGEGYVGRLHYTGSEAMRTSRPQ